MNVGAYADADAGCGVPGLKRCVYVGDSMSDLAALACADIGIVVGTNALLRRVAAAAGLSLRPLHEGDPSLPRA